MTNKKVTLKPVSPEIDSLVKQHGDRQEAVLEILTEIQAKNGVLTRDTLDGVASSLDMSPARVQGIATFYSMLDVSQEIHQPGSRTVRICDGPVCWLFSRYNKSITDEVSMGHPELKIERSSCLGLCDRAPAALLGDEQGGTILSTNKGEVLLEETKNYKDYYIPRPGEVRVLLENAGKMNPDSLESCLALGAYQGLQEALKHSPEQVLQEVEKSNLLGRGGAGFPVGRKWRYVAAESRTPKFIVCNADESEPLIFKDRVLIDTNPHQILEGMAIAGYATCASIGYIYIRGEYTSQARRLEFAINQAEKAGWLGKNIAGTGFSFIVHVHRGAGAYICGEETALIESLEGKRGEPRVRPPYPPSYGYRTLPTLVNNVESLSAVPHILLRGAEWYKNLSTGNSGGTKLYMVLGHVNNSGLFEAPLGLTLRQIIDDFGGGLRPGSKFQFALCGGAAGTIVDGSLLDTPIDYNSTGKGISLGAGAFLICDESVSPVVLLRELLHFFSMESCGKCTPCRVGTILAFEILVRLSEGNGFKNDIQELISLADVMQNASFCGLGQSVQLPVRSALVHFKDKFESGIMRR